MRLDVRLIVPGPDAGTILLDDQGCLPRVAADGDADEGSVVAIDDALRSELRLVVPILESYPRWDAAGDGDVVPTLATTEAPSRSWKPPNFLFFGQLPDAILEVADALQPRAAEWLSQLRTGAAPPPLRPRWSRPRWMGRAGAWMASAALAAGRPLVGEPRPFYLRAFLRSYARRPRTAISTSRQSSRHSTLSPRSRGGWQGALPGRCPTCSASTRTRAGC
jgi:hypothetical protein